MVNVIKSLCYVVLPDNLLTNEKTIYAFLESHIAVYNSELEVEPYQQFFSKEETVEIAKQKGFHHLVEFQEYLKVHGKDEGIENGLYFWITTFNLQGRWDGYHLKGVEKGFDLMNGVLPYSVVTPDGKWHSEADFRYKPILDFENHFNRHPDNIEPEKKWREFLEGFFQEYRSKNMAVLQVHS